MDAELIQEVYIPIIAILSSIALPIVVATILIFKKINSTHKERIGMIQQGIIPPNESTKKSTPNKYTSLRNGFVLIGLGVGVTVGLIGVRIIEFAFVNSVLFIVASSLLFLGIGYLVYFLIVKDVKETETTDLETETTDLENDAE